jgi:hypothetical protein
MNKNNRVGLAGLLLALVSVSPPVMANSVVLYYGPYSYSAGGEFTAVTDPIAFNANYAASTLVATGSGTGFQTFCVQTGVEFTPYNWGNPTPYNYTTSLSSVGPSDAFALSAGTAYLYWQFATGQLKGYDYVDTATRIQDAGELQAAIWDLQGGQSYGGFPSGVGNGTTGNPFYNDALKALGSSVIDESVNASDNFGVEIMNLTDGNGNSAQNQLVYTGGGINTHIQTVPDGGTTLWLLAAGAAGLMVFARRTVAVQQAL